MSKFAKTTSFAMAISPALVLPPTVVWISFGSYVPSCAPSETSPDPAAPSQQIRRRSVRRARHSSLARWIVGGLLISPGSRLQSRRLP